MQLKYHHITHATKQALPTKKPITAWLWAFCTIALTGCGFALRTAPSAQPTTNPTPIVLNINSTDQDLILAINTALSQKLAQPITQPITQLDTPTPMTANTTANAKTTADIELNNITLQRYELLGVLSEIRLVLSGTVSYPSHSIPSHSNSSHSSPIYSKQSYPVSVSYSYQHNEATIAQDNDNAIRAWLYNEFASQIAEQYHLLHSSP